MIKKTLTALILTGAFASAQADVILQQNFDNVAALPGAGWVMNNASAPAGVTGWYQGDQQLFTSHSGAPESYAAANFNNAAEHGQISNWLISPQFSTSTTTAISLWLRGLDDRGFFDQVAFASSNGGSAIADFTVNAVTIAPIDGWTLYTLTLGAQATGSSGRFAIQYYGNQDNANYIGVDDFSVNRIPEPASMLLMATGLMGLAAARRRRPRG